MKVNELFTKGMSEAFKAGASHEEEDKFADYMKGGACRESFMALAECSDGDKPDKQMAMLDCMEAHSDYHHKYLEIIDEQVSKQAMEELESMFPGGEGELVLGVHEFFTKGEGGCCKEQYMAYMDCNIEKVDEGDQYDPLLTTFTQRLLRIL
ncbi:unnamed protein product [Eruca vesicaria subsp. sativa]|uniref:GCK domain-containing protein n=1 Tax=Eruca vesicaria subsp. sativa TaxID=29727 RepID=A0ABC8LYB7_ERUVS|nr:unnamed protein product [Eruca vesicaria subsp. sativa]